MKFNINNAGMLHKMCVVSLVSLVLKYNL